MSFSFLEPWLAFLACVLALAAALAFVLLRNSVSALMVLGAAFFCLAGSGIAISARVAPPVHAAVLDVSDSMESRLPESRARLDHEISGYSEFRRYQLSGALRGWGEPSGGRTNYRGLSTLSASIDFTGECVLMTDGRGRLDELLGAMDPSRLVLLRAPRPTGPDPAITSISGPAQLQPGATGALRAELVSDIDTAVNWRLINGNTDIDRGSMRLTAGLAQSLTRSFVGPDSGLVRVKLVLESARDRESRNNAASFGVLAGGKRVVLYCRNAEISDASDALLSLLRSDLNNELRAVSRLPGSSADLDGVAAVVINDLPLSKGGLAREGLIALANWVRGGGRLMMAGARGAFGPGGYRETLVEELMPVTFRPDDDPPRRVLLLLDCSDSMRGAAGGQTRLDLMKLAALRVLGRLGERDFAAVAGFSEGCDPVEFLPLRNKRELEARVERLKPRSTTRVLSAINAGIAAFSPSGGEQGRILMITDGDDSEAADLEGWKAAGKAAAGLKLGVDVVLTEPAERPWVKVFRDSGAPGANASVGAGGFAEILDALEKALSASEQGLLDDGRTHGGFVVPGVNAELALLCRTAARKELARQDLLLDARTPDGEWKKGNWPLLARREMAGRSVALCTETHGGALWRDEGFIKVLSASLSFLLAGADQQRLQLLASERGAELVWVAQGPPPEVDLTLAGGQVAKLVSAGRWELAEYPLSDDVQIFAGDKLIASLTPARFPPAELAFTGDDERFFAAARRRGIRVLDSLESWRPLHDPGQGPRPWGLGWLAAALGIACLLAGYWFRGR